MDFSKASHDFSVSCDPDIARGVVIRVHDADDVEDCFYSALTHEEALHLACVILSTAGYTTDTITNKRNRR